MTFKWLSFIGCLRVINHNFLFASLPDKHLVQIRKQISEIFVLELLAHVLHDLETVWIFSITSKATVEEIKKECGLCKYYKNWYQSFFRLRTQHIHHIQMVYSYLLDWIFRETLNIDRDREVERERQRETEEWGRLTNMYIWIRWLRHVQKSGLFLSCFYHPYTSFILEFTHNKYTEFVFMTVARDLFISYI